mgnify:CR=1 FL=1
MQRGIIGLGMWCVDTTYKIDNLPERGKLEPISNTFQCVGGGPSNVLTDLNSLGFKISFAKTLLRNNYLKEVAKKLSIDDIVIETDSYPQYFKKNRERWTEPKDVVLVANELASIKNLSVELVGERTKENFKSFIKTYPK